MNFDAFWQTHRRFILGYAGGVLGFFVLLFLLTGSARDSRVVGHPSDRRTVLQHRDHRRPERVSE